MSKVANLLFPADYFDKRLPDGAMRAEYEAAVAEGRLDVSLFDLELFDERGTVSLARPFLDPELPLVYRGWMMKPGEYRSFHRALVGFGLRPITSPEAYAEFHMFPLAYERYEALRSSLPDLLAFPGNGADAGAVNERFERFMIKDYVKSVKGTSFPASVRTPISQGDLDALVAEFVRLRGGLFTEGIVLKEIVDLRRCSDATNEWRTFYLQGKLLNVCRNSNQHASAPAPPARLVSSCESLGSPYYTVDFAELVGGGWVVIETGDGQVSGLAAAQDPVIYYQVLADRMGEGRSMPLCYDEAGSLILSASMVDCTADVGDLFARHAQELLALEGSDLREVLLVWDKCDGRGVSSVGWLYDEPIVLRFDEVDLVVSSSYRCCQPALSFSFAIVDLGSPIRMISNDWEDSERINGLYNLEWRAYDPMQHLFGLKAYGFCLASDERKHATAVRFWLEGEIPIRVGEAFDETRIDVLNEIDAEYAEEYELYDALLLPARRDDRGVPYPTCPRCGSRDVARIVGGRPINFTRELDKYARGLLRLGSCVISFDSPRWHCNACHKPFGRIPLPLSLYPHFNRTPSMVEEAWPHTQGNRSEVESSMYCGCYGCLQIVTRFEIRDWLSDSYGYGETALCPKCGLDAIIGDASGFPINRELLAGMHSHWLE